MITASEQVLEVQAARHYLYSLGQLLLGSEPTLERLGCVDPALLTEALDILGVEDDCGIVAAFKGVCDNIDAAKSLYTKLFIGPATPKAMPWESTYRSRSRALFRQETLAVRNAYRAQGFLPNAYPKVADDHIAIELGFLAALANRAVREVEDGNEEAACATKKASNAFLEEHVLTWIDSYAADLEAAAPNSLYGSAARLMAEVAQRDRALCA